MKEQIQSEEDKLCIRSSLNKEDNRIDVFFEGKDDFFKNRNKEKDIVLYSLLREINVFLLHFRLFSIEWARNYMEIINSCCQENPTPTTTDFIEIKMTDQASSSTSPFKPDVVIRRGAVSIEISNTATEELLNKVGGLLHA